jgi:hypothetical protein
VTILYCLASFAAGVACTWLYAAYRLHKSVSTPAPTKDQT